MVGIKSFGQNCPEFFICEEKGGVCMKKCRGSPKRRVREPPVGTRNIMLSSA